MDNKFITGSTYRSNSMNGHIADYIILDRTDHTVTVREILDGNEDFNKYSIEIENGIEKIKIWENTNHEAWIYANEGKF